MKLFPLNVLFFFSIFAFSAIDEATIHSEKIVLGSGCFWGAEKGYEALPGVIDAVSGYADGEGVRPSYREITKLKHKFNPNNHAEVVEVTYNKNIISTEDLLIHYFESHDPTQLNRQGNDVGPQYRSIILFHDARQQVLAQEYIQKAADQYSNPIVTEVAPYQAFFKAEVSHQDYYANNPNQSYCRFVIQPKVEKFEKSFSQSLKETKQAE